MFEFYMPKIFGVRVHDVARVGMVHAFDSWVQFGRVLSSFRTVSELQ
jgi:hypothetical protein